MRKYEFRACAIFGVLALVAFLSCGGGGSTRSDIPAAPSGLTGTALSPNSVRLTWTDNSDNETGFVVFRDDGGWHEVGTPPENQATFTDQMLQDSTTYRYYVVARNGDGNSTPSQTIAVTTLGVGGLIRVLMTPECATLDVGESADFDVTVEGSLDQGVNWYVQDVLGGDGAAGAINFLGIYTAPINEPDQDSLMIKAVSRADLISADTAWVTVIDRSRINVSPAGSDTQGDGSRRRPYRSITKALGTALSGQAVLIAAGEYGQMAGERFPLRVTSGIALIGAAGDSTKTIGPGGMNQRTDAMIEIDGDNIRVERLHITSSNSLGVGVWIKPGFQVVLSGCLIDENYIGVYADGAAVPRPLLDGNRIERDSIGIVTADTSRPTIRNSQISNCYKYGVEIRNSSAPDLGANNAGGTGGNIIRECGDASFHWLIYNGSTNTIWALGNAWQAPDPIINDRYIFDDEESAGTSGRVILAAP